MSHPITEQDERAAREFCDDLGCTKVHLLRDELPSFVARIRQEATREAVEQIAAYLDAEAAGFARAANAVTGNTATGEDDVRRAESLRTRQTECAAQAKFVRDGRWRP